MRNPRTLAWLIALAAAFAGAGAHAQSVELRGWRPSEWRLVPGTPATAAPGEESRPREALASGSTLRLRLDTPTAALTSADGTISLAPSTAGLPANCALDAGASANVRAFSAECVAAAAVARSRQAEARASLEWMAGPVSLVASVGGSASTAPLLESMNPLGSLPVWLLDGSPADRVSLAGGAVSTRTRDVSVAGNWRVNSSVTVQLMGSVGTVSANAAASPLVSIDAEQTVLGFGVSRGSLSGSVTGRRLTPLSPLRANDSVTALDLGVSWRTPWQGELTFGARELSRPGTASADTAQAAKAREERTPYVQYRQDL